MEEEKDPLDKYTDEELTKALEEQAIWDIIGYLEDRLDELDELENLTKKQEKEYKEKTEQLFELLDKAEKNK